MSGAIQVYFEDRLVGALEGFRAVNGEIPIEIPIIRQTDSIRKFGPNVADQGDMIWIPTKEIFMTISRKSFEKIGLDALETAWQKPSIFAKHFGIPSYADKTRFPQQDCVEFSWRVVNPNIDQYEIMFDLPNFKPL